MIELTKDYIDNLKDIITEKDDAKIKEILDELYPADIAELYQELNLQEARSAEYAAGQNRFKRTLVRDPGGDKYHRSNHAEAGTEKMSVAADRTLKIFKTTRSTLFPYTTLFRSQVAEGTPERTDCQTLRGQYGDRRRG